MRAVTVVIRPSFGFFWDLMHNDLDYEQKRQFLLFVTGSALSPLGGLGELRLTIQRASPDSQLLPTSSTCFHTLLLPDYSSKEKLKTKLLIALSNSEGFGLE